MASRLKQFALKNFAKGYNSYTQSKSMVDDEEIPYGLNCCLDNNGSVVKAPGVDLYYGSEISAGNAIDGMARYKTTSVVELLIAGGGTLYKVTTSSKTAISGKTFTAGRQMFFTQALNREYMFNGVENMCYYDGSTITEVTSNGIVATQGVYFNSRIYAISAANPDRIYYSNPYNSDGTVGNLGTFDTNLGASPVKNAGFIMLKPGSGVEVKFLVVQGDYLYAYTKTDIWKIAFAQLNTDNSVAHSVSLLITSNGTPAPRSIFPLANDQWFYNYDNYYSLGEQAQYQNIRTATKSGRIKSEIDDINQAARSGVAGILFKDRAFLAYPIGSYNDRVAIYDSRLNAWSCPLDYITAACFLDFEDSNGIHHLLAGSSNSGASYVYELESGTDNVNSGIEAVFETKSTDCDLPGLVKRFAFIDVFYGTVFGTLNYEVYIDEEDPITGSIQIGNSTDKTVAIGSLAVGTFVIGEDFDPNTTFASLAQNDNFRIELGYNPGKKISVRFSNSNLGEQFRINGIVAHFLPGSVQEQ